MLRILSIRYTTARAVTDIIYGEYDTGSERTLAACLNDASLREWSFRVPSKVANG